MEPKEFDWDEGNINKNLKKHNVSDHECEEVFFISLLIVYYDKWHSTKEDRFYALGETFAGRKIFVVFTIRDGKIRIISARDMNKKERRIYEKRKEKNT